MNRPGGPEIMTLRDTLERMQERFQPARARGVRGIVQYEVAGSDGAVWHTVISDGTCSVNEGPASRPPSLMVELASIQDWQDLESGKRSGAALYILGRLRLRGDMSLAMLLGTMFPVPTTAETDRE